MESPILQLSQYEAWADAQLVGSLSPSVQADPKLLRLLGHLVAAKEIWLDRVDGVSVTASLWPEVGFEECIRRLRTVDARLLDHSPAAATDPERLVEYRTTTGAAQQTPVRIIWTHLINHGTYHRGQFATALKAAGGQPAVTDFIAWHRAGMP